MSIAKPTDLATTLPRFTGLGKTTFSGLFCLGLILTASSCQRDGAGLSGEPVSWQELANFDEIAYRADGLARVGDLAAVHASRAELLAAGRAVTPQTVPSNVADPKQVESILADLT
ncbi:MAG TPA: hypothetical protein DCY79_06285, partial [Planctomycetaceae bacterium]|nr:hypothetical protein [Planctomycetaceae bacterium]